MKKNTDLTMVCHCDLLKKDQQDSSRILCYHKIGKEIAETALKQKHLFQVDKTLHREIENRLEKESGKILLCVKNNGHCEMVSDKQCAATHIFEIATKIFYADKDYWP